jgi:hypothetical protein
MVIKIFKTMHVINNFKIETNLAHKEDKDLNLINFKNLYSLNHRV